MDLKSLTRPEKPNSDPSMIDLTYDYTLVGDLGRFVAVKKYNPRDECCATIRALMRQAREGDEASRRVLRWIVKAMLEEIDRSEGDPHADDRDLLLALKQHWAELVADGLPSETPAEKKCRGYIAAADARAQRQ